MAAPEPLRGEVWEVNFPGFGLHPSVVVSVNAVNARLGHIAVIPITGTPTPIERSQPKVRIERGKVGPPRSAPRQCRQGPRRRTRARQSPRQAELDNAPNALGPKQKWGPALLPAPTAPSEGSAGVRNLVPGDPFSILAHQLRRRFPSISMKPGGLLLQGLAHAHQAVPQPGDQQRQQD